MNKRLNTDLNISYQLRVIANIRFLILPSSFLDFLVSQSLFEIILYTNDVIIYSTIRGIMSKDDTMTGVHNLPQY